MTQLEISAQLEIHTTTAIMSAATILSQAYGEGACLYETVLEVSKSATPSQLRKAYYKKALQYHPDKLSGSTAAEREDAKLKFQAISMAYTILSDEEKRAEYDETGDLYDDDEMSLNKSGVKQWTDYFKNIFPSVTTADIDAFEVKYKCSDEEEADVLKYYLNFKGDLNKMIECVMLSSDADKERWVKDYIKPAIDSGDVKDYTDKLQKTMGTALSKKKKSKGRKAEHVMEVEDDEISDEDDDDVPCAVIVDDDDMNTDLKEENNPPKSKGKSSAKTSPKKKTSTKKASVPSKLKKSSENDLIAQIRGNAVARRQEGFDSMMAGLEERYGGKKKGRGKKVVDDIPDDEFEKIQSKMLKNRKNK